MVEASYSSSSLLKISSMVSASISVPRRSLILVGLNSILLRSLRGAHTSTTPPTTSPQPSSSISAQALLMASMAFLGSTPFSNFPDASVLKPSLLADFLIFAPLKVAASKSMVLTSSVILLFSPPMIPAIPMALPASLIMSISLSRVLS